MRNWQPDDDGYSDGNWCPDCGLPHEVCTCDFDTKVDRYESDTDDPADYCTHDCLDSEGFCIDCGVHVSDRLNVPKTDDDDESD